MSTHGYGAYSTGCRCEVCRSAKAAYMRERRAAGRDAARAATDAATWSGPRGARAVAAETGARRYVSPVAQHGTRAGYEECGCRCFDCTDAATRARARERARAKERAS